MTESCDPKQNKLLAALPDVELLRLLPELDSVELRQGQALYESGAATSCVYFPTTALISTVYEFEDGALAETAVVGNEGLVGIPVFMGVTRGTVAPSCCAPGTRFECAHARCGRSFSGPAR